MIQDFKNSLQKRFDYIKKEKYIVNEELINRLKKYSKIIIS